MLKHILILIESVEQHKLVGPVELSKTIREILFLLVCPASRWCPEIYIINN